MKKLKIFEPFETESGDMIPNLEIAYSTYGELNTNGDNVVWVCHALTANSEVVDWWKGLVGAGYVINPEEHFIICANVLGGCYGTTGPLSEIESGTEKYHHEFPLITIRDIVRVHQLLSNHLGIEKIKIGIGGSLGGQQILEWSIMQPLLFENLILIATNARHSAYGIAFNEAQRLAIEADPSWKENRDDAGLNGLLAARSIALLSYRHYESYQSTQLELNNDQIDNYSASRYQRYQGEKLVKRFNAFSYFTLSKAMDSHHVGRHRESIAAALQKITAKTLVLNISNDILFPLSEQTYLADQIENATLEIVESIYGHDGFLIEVEKISLIIKQFLNESKEHTKQINKLFNTTIK